MLPSIRAYSFGLCAPPVVQTLLQYRGANVRFPLVSLKCFINCSHLSSFYCIFSIHKIFRKYATNSTTTPHHMPRNSFRNGGSCGISCGKYFDKTSSFCQQQLNIRIPTTKAPFDCCGPPYRSSECAQSCWCCVHACIGQTQAYTRARAHAHAHIAAGPCQTMKNRTFQFRIEIVRKTASEFAHSMHSLAWQMVAIVSYICALC